MGVSQASLLPPQCQAFCNEIFLNPHLTAAFSEYDRTCFRKMHNGVRPQVILFNKSRHQKSSLKNKTEYKYATNKAEYKYATFINKDIVNADEFKLTCQKKCRVV